MPKRKHTRTGPLGTAYRRLRLRARQINRALPLAKRFLFIAVVVVAFAMALLGKLIGLYLQSSIAAGVAQTAAASIEALIAEELVGVNPRLRLSPSERQRLDEVFVIGNNAESTRLLQIRIWSLSGALLYQSLGGLEDTFQPDAFSAARQGRVTSTIERIPLEPVGSIGDDAAMAVLAIYTPVHRPDDGEPFAVAALFYSARSVLELQARAQFDVWLVVGLIGLVVIGALYMIVDRASRTILAQRARLASNLMASRRLSEENHALHAASERLRLNANFANERLLAQVGSDIHDGPLQLLTLVILRLTRAAAMMAGKDGSESAELQATIQLATETMEELRNISTGLVLPELAPLSPEQSIELAITRHEEATGTTVRRKIGSLPANTSMAVKICAYRVVQEALNNAFRHGGNAEPLVSAEAEGGRLRLAISNARRGGVESEAAEEPTNRLGIAGMRFRVESLGGVLSTDIGSGRGTATVAAEIPLGSGEAA